MDVVFGHQSTEEGAHILPDVLRKQDAGASSVTVTPNVDLCSRPGTARQTTPQVHIAAGGKNPTNSHCADPQIAPPLPAIIAPPDHHRLQESCVLPVFTALEVPLTSRSVLWATRRQQEVALPQAAGSLRVQTLWYLMETNSTRVYAPMMYPRTRIFGIFVLLRSGIPSTLKSGATTSAKTVGLAFQAVLQLQKRARVSGTIMVFVH